MPRSSKRGTMRLTADILKTIGAFILCIPLSVCASAQSASGQTQSASGQTQSASGQTQSVSGEIQTAPAVRPHLSSAPMNENQRELLAQSMALFDASYDPSAHLLLHPHDGNVHVRGKYMVRESSWYALGLLMRHAPGDRERALAVLDTVLKNQYMDQHVKWYGTFKRSLEDPSPATGNPPFSSYDPNWRHFVGTILEIILIEYPTQLTPELTARMSRAMDAAIQGEMQDGRLLPSYSNIALLYGALWDFAATRDHNADWQKRSAAWTEEVFRLFRQHDTFNEYNAPTYYGVDLYGLALWRTFGSTARQRNMGSTMEAKLWTSISVFYQPAMRNLAGPYDRAYGMDMTRYVTPTGVWMRTLLDAAQAPLPEHPTLTTYQVADLWFAPQIVLLGTHVPPTALSRIKIFPGPQFVHVQIDAQRAATTWLSAHATWGGEFTSMTKDTGITQFHPATAHWMMPSGEIAWMKVTRSPAIDAIANESGLLLKTSGDVTLRIYVGQNPPALEAKKWSLPGMSIAIETDGQNLSTTQPADCDGCVDVTYKRVHTLRMRMTPSGT
jgi:hypothetical protein